MTPSWKRIGAYLGILCGTIWVVLTTIAMVTFPGGYLFFEYPISALGLTVINSTPSMLNYFLFVSACTGAAVFMVPFTLSMRTLFTETMGLKVLSGLGTVFCLIATPFLSALAIFAGNEYPSLHGWSTIYFFIFIMLGILFYSIAISLNSEYKTIYGAIGFVIVVICILHIVGMFGIASMYFATPIWQK
ncbi:MAG: hypothetical protein ACFFDM_04920, partial [Candidatus Thorarchaeota archaeon]